MSETNTLAMTRRDDTWPRHRVKDKRRHLTRKRIAREAKARRDQAKDTNR